MAEGTTAAIVLVGPMGAGKTSIGRRVARELGVTFTDTDSIVVRDHGAIADLFATQGETRFREIERAAVGEALARGGVVALGGGAVLNADTRHDLAAHRVVLLTVAPHIVRSRIQGEARPLLATDDDPVARWQTIMAARKPLYEEVADVTFDTSSGPLALVVADIVAWVRGQQPAADGAFGVLSEETK
ncbi:shikimate kinase [Microbacterium sp. B2969]|uniref:Shikimate kinase n=1 Tax=Microbacterium alkaliflavum TaxID=3248839 RepID=A0ABW7Q4R6_9MICO